MAKPTKQTKEKQEFNLAERSFLRANPSADSTIKTTLRVSRALWSEILILAVVERTSAQAIVTTALQNYIKERPPVDLMRTSKKGGK